MDVYDDPLSPVFSPQKPVLENKAYSIWPESHQHAWLDIKVFYVRVASTSLGQAPEILTMYYSPGSTSTSIEVNGGRIPHCGDTCLILKRDRLDKESAEVTYVSTDNLRTNGPLSFRVLDKEDLLICGYIERSDCSTVKYGTDSEQSQRSFNSAQHAWRMECTCFMVSSKCSFIRSRKNFSALPCHPPCVEVYLAGQVSGLPVILTETVNLVARRKSLRHETMYTIFEDEHETLSDSLAVDECFQGVERQDSLHTVLAERSTPEEDFLRGDCQYIKQDGFCGTDEHHQCDYLCRSDENMCFEVDDGRFSWFRAGVRVGFGIGLGMCLGLGLGVGILVRTYHSTTKAFNSRTFLRKFL
eukprot:c26120_g1_i1 orf=578-1648(+)